MDRFDIAPYREIAYPNGQLALHSVLSYTREHGPGARFSVWVRGCLKRCLGCTNAHMLEVQDAPPLMTPEELQRQFRQAKSSVAQVNGITLQGGEPMLQAGNLAAALRPLKIEDSNMNLLTFTGYRLEILRSLNNRGVDSLLELTDALIDGEFESAEIDQVLIRGSKKQRIHHLSGSLAAADFTRRPAALGLRLGSEMITYKSGLI